jgi:hypothetical protein
MVRLMIPNAYKFSNGGNSYNKLALMQTLLQITYSTKLMQFEYDPEDGEIRITVDIPVMDSRLTQKQLGFCIECIIHCLDNFHEQILDAMRHGLAPESDADRRRAWEEFKKNRAAERKRWRLLRRFGGETPRQVFRSCPSDVPLLPRANLEGAAIATLVTPHPEMVSGSLPIMDGWGFEWRDG